MRRLWELNLEQPRPLALKLLLALLVVAYPILFVETGLALLLVAVTIYILSLLNIVRKVLD